jgi:hypothetical protein
MTAALKLLVTPAGRAALANAKKNGTLPITLASVGVTATSFTPTGAEAKLPGEIKRIATISGGAVAPDTLHVTIRDSGPETYSVRGVGMYLQDETLFAVYGQAAVVVEKSAQATMLLAMDVQFADIDATSLIFGDTDFQLNPATTEMLGIVELATEDEAVTGADAQRAITPKALLAALNARLGAAAPSPFIKGLLTAASAAVLRTALAIKSAALKDDGAGNGLDADLLDGQHGAYYRSWSNLTGVPASFPPTAHTHAASDITSGMLSVARGGTGVDSLPAGYFLVGTGNGAMLPRAPSDVLADIGAAAKQHSHAISDINGLQAALDSKTTPAAVSAQISAAVNGLVNGAPGALDTLKELADAMGDDPNFATTVTNALAQKLNLSGGTLTGGLAVNGGFAATGGTSIFQSAGTEVSMFMRYNGTVARQVYLSNGGAYNRFGINFTDANGNYAGTGLAMDNATGVLTVRQTLFSMDDNTFQTTAPFRFTGMGANGTMYWHGTNGAGDDVCSIQRLNANSAYNMVWNGQITTQGLLQSNSTSTSAIYAANGGNIRIGSSSGVSRYIRTNPSNGALEIVNNAYNAVVASIEDGGGIVANGAVIAAGGFQKSDRRLKKNIRPRAVQRGLALKIARMFSEWERIADGVRDVGLVAQRVRRVASRYVMRHPSSGMLAIDKPGIALECSMDNALALQEQERRIAALEKIIQRMGKAHG